MANKRIKEDSFEPIHSKDEMIDAIRTVGELQQQHLAIEAKATKKINLIKADAQKQVMPINEQISELSKGIRHYATEHRDELLGKSRAKSVDVSTGIIGWRKKKDAIRVSAALALEALKSLQLLTAIRVKEEVDKELVMADWKTYEHIKGLTYVTGKDQFFIEPSETKLETVEVIS